MSVQLATQHRRRNAKNPCVYLKRRIRSGKDMLLSESSLFTNGSALLTTRKYSL